MADRTTVRLAAALQQVPGMPPAMLRAAIDGYYDDYLSPLAAPVNQLVADLRSLAALPSTGPKARAALAGLVSRAIGGEFDGTREEAEAWAASPEGRAVFRELTDGMPGFG